MSVPRKSSHEYATWAGDEPVTTDRQHEIVLTAVIGRISLDPMGIGDALQEAFTQAGRFVTEQARTDPWDAEVIFDFGGDEYRISGHRK